MKTSGLGRTLLARRARVRAPSLVPSARENDSKRTVPRPSSSRARGERKSHRTVDGNGGRDWTAVRHQPDGNAHPSHVIPDDLRPPPSDGRRKKKPVALLLSYVGGKYEGNTHNAHTTRGSTVDDGVEDALVRLRRAELGAEAIVHLERVVALRLRSAGANQRDVASRDRHVAARACALLWQLSPGMANDGYAPQASDSFRR